MFVLFRQSLVNPALRESNRVSTCPTPDAMHKQHQLFMTPEIVPALEHRYVRRKLCYSIFV